MLRFVSSKLSKRLDYMIYMVVGLLFSVALPIQSTYAAPSEPSGDTAKEIVYIDDQGRLKVLDPIASGGNPIKWESAEAGFYSFALGDFNADGDMEIAVINRTSKQLIVYDPVVASGPNDGSIEGIPWRKLVTRQLNGAPNLVNTGNFDVGVPGDEIVVGYEVDGGNPAYRVDVLKGTSSTPDGTTWTVHATKDFSNIWGDSSVGDVVSSSTGTEDLILRDFGAGTVTVFQMDNNFAETGCKYGPRTDAKPIDIVALQWVSGGLKEVAITREWPADGSITQPRLYVFQCVNNQFVDSFTNKYNSIPFALIAADVNNNGDDELFLIRDLGSNDSRDRMFVENSGNDSIDFHTPLDTDNGFRSGAAGDVDGDSKDEVVIMRSNKIRVYTSPESGASAVNQFTDYPLNTNQYSIKVGDLDKNGFQTGYLLTSDKSSLSATVSAGDGLADAGIFTVKLNTDALSKQHNEPVIEGMPAGVVFNFRTIGDANPGFTPSTYLFNIDATGATTPQPNTPYVGSIAISSNDPEVKNVLRIPFSLTLTYARIEANPTSVLLSYYPCTNSATQVQTFANQVKIDGTPGVTFQVIGGSSGATSSATASPELLPKWLGISPESGTVGDSLSLSIDPTQWSSKQYEEATVILQGDAKTGSQLREFKVGVICAKGRNFLPIMAR